MSAVLRAHRKRLQGSWDNHLVPLAFENDRSLSLGGVSQLNSGSRSSGYSGGATGLTQSQDSLSRIYKPTQESWVRASFEWDFNTRVPPNGLGSCVLCFPKERFAKTWKTTSKCALPE